MELEENAAAAAEARENACTDAPAAETAPADEIKAVPMDAPAADAGSDDAGFDAVDQLADDSADDARGARARRTPQRPPVKPASPESMEEARSVLAHMFDFLGIDANVRVENKPRSVNLYVSTEEPGRVIGHHGKMLLPEPSP